MVKDAKKQEKGEGWVTVTNPPSKSPTVQREKDSKKRKAKEPT